MIALVGAGAISSAGICSLYIAYSLQYLEGEPPLPIEPAPRVEESPAAAGEELEAASAQAAEAGGGGEQSFLVAFLADADPQVRTLAAWGLMSGDGDRPQDILDFVRQERDPEVRASLYRYLQGQRMIDCRIVTELVKQEKNRQTWLASCDLLAGIVHHGAGVEAVEYFDGTVVPELTKSAVNGTDLHMRVAAIIALRRAQTPAAVKALEEIIRTASDVQVVQAASSAFRLVSAEN